MTCARIRGGNPLASGLTIVMKTTLLALVLLSAAWLEKPDRIAPVERMREFRRGLTIDLDPYTVAVIEISAR